MGERTAKRIESFCKYAWKHTTMLDFVTISATVEGIHRAGQDDWDAHARRFDNRIIRSSTRLADFSEGEMSDFYKGKIIPTDVALKEILNIVLPEVISKNGCKYVKTANGYILQRMENDRDVKRGLYMESIPSTFIFKVNMAQWAHVYRVRSKNGTANPEVKQLAEMLQDEIEKQMPWFDREFLAKVMI
jgi:thymidylate synthase ThyX